MVNFLSPDEVDSIRTAASGFAELYPFTRQVERRKMEDAVRRIYKLARLSVPDQFVWATNPVMFKDINVGLKALSRATRHLYDFEATGVEVPEVINDMVPDWYKFRSDLALLDRLPLGLSTLRGLTRDHSPRGDRWGHLARLEWYIDEVSNTAIPSVHPIQHATGCNPLDMYGGVFSRSNLFLLEQGVWIERRSGHVPQFMIDSIDAFRRTVEYGGLWSPYEGGVVLCENPTSLVVNREGRPNNMDGPAVTYPDGYKAYYVNGVNVPEALIEDPGVLTVEQIVKETNQEIRRVMIEKMGVATFLERVEATLEDDDSSHGRLWSTTILRDDLYMRRDPGYWRPIETVRPAKFLEVKNSTPEPDGSFRTFFLRVPPRYKTAKGARAFTFNERKHEFNLVKET